MKLVIITAIQEFENDIKTMLKKAKVKSFTHTDVMGYNDISEESLATNWFANEMNKTDSILFYAFVNKENVDLLFDLVKDFNAKQKSLSNIHVASLNIEKSN